MSWGNGSEPLKKLLLPTRHTGNAQAWEGLWQRSLSHTPSAHSITQARKYLRLCHQYWFPARPTDSVLQSYWRDCSNLDSSIFIQTGLTPDLPQGHIISSNAQIPHYSWWANLLTLTISTKSLFQKNVKKQHKKKELRYANIGSWLFPVYFAVFLNFSAKSTHFKTKKKFAMLFRSTHC